MENLLKEIDLIQSCIKRMAQNSFIVKGWMLSLITIVLTLCLAKDFDDNKLSLIVIIPLFSFWFLDAYYLQTEKKFRELYKWVINNRIKTQEYLFNLDPNRFSNNVPTIFKIMFSKTVWPIYISTFFICILLFILL